MADFKRSSGGPKRFNGGGHKASFGGKPGYANKGKGNWSDRRSESSERSTTFYKATCSKCGDACEVPFRPVNGKPVFCRNCFVKTDDTRSQGRAGDRFQKREYASAPVTRAEFPKSDNAPILKQLDILNTKLDRLIAAIESTAQKAALATAVHAAVADETPVAAAKPKKEKKGYPKKKTA